jgi:hypothetical protein
LLSCDCARNNYGRLWRGFRLTNPAGKRSAGFAGHNVLPDAKRLVESVRNGTLSVSTSKCSTAAGSSRPRWKSRRNPDLMPSTGCHLRAV